MTTPATIRELTIVGFKRFSETSLEFAPLTVLTGTNGAGKTSVIHALLLARQAAVTQSDTVKLNGPFNLELGSAQDVLNLQASSAQISVRLRLDGDAESRFAFDASEEALLYLPIQREPGQHTGGALHGSERHFTYLCAERLGPRDVLGASALPREDLSVGVRGEFCAQVLTLQGLQEKVPPARRHPQRADEENAFLKYQVESWLSDIVRPVEIETLAFAHTSVTALRFRAPGGDWVRAPNMGFGVSYALPIVLAGLMAAPGGLLVVENPEAHLHPAGQSRIGVFLATLASGGVQVVVETHSDHVINGIRRAVGEHKLLEAADAVIHFFDQETESRPTISTLRFTQTGGLDAWPRRFFDQYQIDVAALARLRRGPPR